MRYAAPLFASIQEYFPPCDTVLFTDETQKDFGQTVTVFESAREWPYPTILLYRIVSKQRELMLQYDQVFWMDIDMLVCSKIEADEICSDGITAVLHHMLPNFFERNPKSTAYVEGSHPYYQGCFWGGESKAIVQMCETLARNVDIDLERGIVALWHDESHLNRYLVDHPPAKVLTSAYAYPGEHLLMYPDTLLVRKPKPNLMGLRRRAARDVMTRFKVDGEFEPYTPKIRHIEKPNRDYWERKS